MDRAVVTVVGGGGGGGGGAGYSPIIAAGAILSSLHSAAITDVVVRPRYRARAIAGTSMPAAVIGFPPTRSWIMLKAAVVLTTFHVFAFRALIALIPGCTDGVIAF